MQKREATPSYTYYDQPMQETRVEMIVDAPRRAPKAKSQPQPKAKPPDLASSTARQPHSHLLAQCQAPAMPSLPPLPPRQSPSVTPLRTKHLWRLWWMHNSGTAKHASFEEEETRKSGRGTRPACLVATARALTVAQGDKPDLAQVQQAAWGISGVGEPRGSCTDILNTFLFWRICKLAATTALLHHSRDVQANLALVILRMLKG
ncbi:hypothetical protein EI94DRAFT_1706927 [Lactarius quietus]|nr:hypothetical protein EI94DRAFT_1706927 [Lactarius quietus]